MGPAGASHKPAVLWGLNWERVSRLTVTQMLNATASHLAPHQKGAVSDSYKPSGSTPQASSNRVLQV